MVLTAGCMHLCPGKCWHWTDPADGMQCRLYGSNICGEGGEYETLALGGPLFRHAAIHLDAWDVRLHSPDSVAPVGVLHPVDFYLIPTPGCAHTHQAEAAARTPDEEATQGVSSSLAGVITVPPDFWAAPMRRGQPADARPAGGSALTARCDGLGVRMAWPCLMEANLVS